MRRRAAYKFVVYTLPRASLIVLIIRAFSETVKRPSFWVRVSCASNKRSDRAKRIHTQTYALRRVPTWLWRRPLCPCTELQPDLDSSFTHSLTIDLRPSVTHSQIVGAAENFSTIDATSIDEETRMPACCQGATRDFQ